MKLALLLMPLLLAGCLSTPVNRTFPAVPDDLKIACPSLQEVDSDTTKLSTVVTVVVENYGSYQECKIKVDTWIEWYKDQKRIFDSVK